MKSACSLLSQSAARSHRFLLGTFVFALCSCTHGNQGIELGGNIPPSVGTEILGLPPIDPNLQYNHTFVQQTEADFFGWSKNGIVASRDGNRVRLVLSPEKQGTLRCESVDIDGGMARFDAASGLCAGTDPMPGGLPSGVNYYSGGSFFFGTMTSPEVTPRAPIDHLIASWNAQTPPGTWLQLRVRMKVGGEWSRYYKLPIWSSDAAVVKRHSIKEAADDTGYVDTDTFELRNQKTATAYQLSVTLFSSAYATMQKDVNKEANGFDKYALFSSRLSYAQQIIIARKFSDRFSFQIAPTMVHYNLAEHISDKNDVYILAAATRFKFTKRMALTVEYGYRPLDYTRQKYYDSLGIGIDIETGGHVFQLFATNSFGLLENQFLTHTTDKWSNMGIRFGFNVSRVFSL